MNQEQIDNFNNHQQNEWFHPFTCDRKSKNCEVNCIPRDYSKDGVLIGTEQGLVCPCGDYTQSSDLFLNKIV